jgi:hypothetical protein
VSSLKGVGTEPRSSFGLRTRMPLVEAEKPVKRTIVCTNAVSAGVTPCAMNRFDAAPLAIAVMADSERVAPPPSR